MARPRQVSDEEILDIARACFLEHGATVSTSHIAREVGLSQAALFKRFHTKDNLLLLALAPPARPPWLDLLEAGVEAAPVPDQLVTIGVHALKFLRDLMPRVMVLKASGVDPEVLLRRFAEPPPVLAHRLLAGWFADAEAAGRIRCDDPAAMASHFLGGLHIRAYMGHMFGHQASDAHDADYVRHLVRSLWRGIAPVEGA